MLYMHFNVKSALKCYILCLLLWKYGGYLGLYGYWRSHVDQQMTTQTSDDNTDIK